MCIRDSTIAECYAVLGKVHSLWRPIPNRIKDYIGQPKPNGYRSLHTTVFGDDSKPFEVQIRTRKMHRECEFGVAAHWRYKENKKTTSEFDDAMSFLRQIVEWQQEGGKDVNNEEFMETLKTDFFSREIYVYSPTGEVYSLPINSCSIDFAYKIHTEVGNSCVGAKVNGRMVPITQPLKTGDLVEIITSKNSQGPSRDWLNIVKSNQAKSKIKQYFKRYDKEDNIEIGKSSVARDLKKYKQNYRYLLKDEWLAEIASDLGFPSEDEMYASVGYGKTTAEQVSQKLIRKDKEELKKKELSSPLDISKKEINTQVTNEIRVSDLDEDVEVKFAKCCTPVPGDPIIGFITKGNGISVHVKTCPNIINSKSPERLIDVYWQNLSTDKFPVKIQIISANGPSILFEVSKMMSTFDVNILSINARTDSDAGIMDLVIEVSSTEQLDNVIKKLKTIKTVSDVFRVKS